MDQRFGYFALCLSGGGFRAALFHLGALRRLNELGILSQVDVVSSVSGGSILAAHWAEHINRTARNSSAWPEPGGVWLAFDEMAKSLHSKLARHLPIASTLSFHEVIMRKLPRGFKKWVGSMQLKDLPKRPDFIFNATELKTGRVFSFSRSKVGSDGLGYNTRYGHALVAEAVIASANFPAFDQLRARFQASDFERESPQTGEIEILLTDGGVYDNLGVEKVSDAATVLVSDGGKGARPLSAPTDAGAKPDVQQPTMSTPARNQYEALQWIVSRASRDPAHARGRLEKLSSRIAGGEIVGAYWSIGDGSGPGQPASVTGYSSGIAEQYIAEMRTQLDAFSEPERQVLENHGYLVANAAVRKQAPGLIQRDQPLTVPWPEALSDDYARNHLRHSGNLSSGVRGLMRFLGTLGGNRSPRLR